jgi:hypothetical protein
MAQYNGRKRPLGQKALASRVRGIAEGAGVESLRIRQSTSASSRSLYEFSFRKMVVTERRNRRIWRLLEMLFEANIEKIC